MSIDYSNRPRTAVRRDDRQVKDNEWIKALLHRAPVGYLATLKGDQPFINSNLFVFDPANDSIYLHTAKKGRTRSNLNENITSNEQDLPKVCFTVTELGRLLPAKEALEFSVEYNSVIIFGRGQVVKDHAKASIALQMLLDKYAPHLRPGRDYRPIVEEELKRTAVFKIKIEEWTGKKKEVAPDFPGAYYYGQTPSDD